MKKANLFAIIIIMILLLGCATMMGVKADPEMRTFEKIIEIQGTTKNDLYVKANSWFVDTFNSAESVIEYQDKEAGKIMGKYILFYKEGIYSYMVRQIISVDIKNNKVRFIIKNPYYTITGDALNGQYIENIEYRTLDTQAGLKRVHIEWNKLVQSFTNYLNKKTNW